MYDPHRLAAMSLVYQHGTNKTMNWCEIQNNWPQMGGLVQTQWPKITDGDLQTIDGDRSALADMLRSNYQLQDSEVETSIAAFEKDCRRPGAIK